VVMIEGGGMGIGTPDRPTRRRAGGQSIIVHISSLSFLGILFFILIFLVFGSLLSG
jgi:hypothetical protein